jgi:hypothetical protein
VSAPESSSSSVTERREELVVHLRRPEDLVVVEPRDLLDDSPDAGPVRAVPGVEEILGELLGRPHLRRRRRVVLTLPADALADPMTAPRMIATVARWTRARAERTERETRVLWRQGLTSLPAGTLLFVVGVLISTDFLAEDVPGVLQELLGNGVFLVIAWIGLWYPLDVLFFARSPARREMRALDALGRMPVEVRPRT